MEGYDPLRKGDAALKDLTEVMGIVYVTGGLIDCMMHQRYGGLDKICRANMSSEPRAVFALSCLSSKDANITQNN